MWHSPEALLQSTSSHSPANNPYFQNTSLICIITEQQVPLIPPTFRENSVTSQSPTFSSFYHDIEHPHTESTNNPSILSDDTLSYPPPDYESANNNDPSLPTDDIPPDNILSFPPNDVPSHPPPDYVPSYPPPDYYSVI